MTKTNVIRILESAGAPHVVHEYDTSDGKIDGVSVAAKCGRPADMVFKTLVTTGKTTGPNVFVVPVEFELDLKKAATAAGDKYIEMIKSKDLEPLTGYIHGGCSPIGMKKKFPTFIDETALLNDTICVSAGRVGLQAELAPGDLARIAGAEFRDLI
ncbi:MAG: Cys-tRNA(Pro) deacylase [Clostridiales Family XIII bacterium]|jgi:Cys-tRNA(Pro)/Cys-tRNA(Cys) deacylase|nr:Cys-tRNA(Pro) deacylase [Clostridiales Family XIII bacterium]